MAIAYIIMICRRLIFQKKRYIKGDCRLSNYYRLQSQSNILCLEVRLAIKQALTDAGGTYRNRQNIINHTKAVWKYTNSDIRLIDSEVAIKKNYRAM